MKTTAKELKKLQRALELMKSAQKLINDISASNENFRYDLNTNILDSRVSGAVSLLEDTLDN